jgi:phosphoglycerate dehydrogenase-like enzyme
MLRLKKGTPLRATRDKIRLIQGTGRQIMITILYLGAEVGAKAAAEVVADKAKIQEVVATPEAVLAAITTCDAILDASMKVRLTDEMLAGAGNLKIISCATTGSDHIDRNVLTRRDIPVRTLREDRALLLNLTPAAELSWALVLACARNLPAAFDHVKAGGWTRERFPGMMLNGRRMGIVGCGRIGTWMSRYAHAFGMRIFGYDPHIAELPDHMEPVSLPELVATSDVISVHVPLTAETTGLISAEQLRSVKQGAILVNTSRGAVVNEAALLEALKSKRLCGAGLDVLADEPDVEKSALIDYARRHDNLIITPHCGGFSPDAVRVVCRRAAEKIMEWLNP